MKHWWQGWDKRRCGASFWVIHGIGCAAIFGLGVRTASRAAVPIAVYRIVRRILAK